MALYKFLNLFFFAFHSLLMLFNIFGWAVPRLRKWNLATLLLTACSWFVLGIWFGWGYCVCTDWHWQVRRHLGYTNDPNSYVQLLLQNILGLHLPARLVDTGTAVVFFASLAISIWLNVRDWRRR
ncbi:MAG TPA: DUF2784 domain-containing protein [Puia sp.]|nr:DUF2784 domain-containing protein [Puia sp.]